MRRYSGHHTDIDSCLLDRFTNSESVDYRRHHPHLISCHPIESASFELNPSEYIPTADHDRDLETSYLYEMYDLLSDIGEELWIDTISLFSLEGLTRELQEDSFRCVVFLHMEWFI
jgi:hypothetical protein